MWRRGNRTERVTRLPGTQGTPLVFTRSRAGGAPAGLRVQCVLVAILVAISGCTTTMAVSPQSLAATAGLPEGKESNIRGSNGPQPVDGSTRVTLHYMNGATGAVSEVPLSQLRSVDGALILPGDNHPLMLGDIWSAEIEKADPGKTAGLVVGVTLGVAALAGAAYLISAVMSAFNSCNNAWANSDGDAVAVGLGLILLGHGNSQPRIHR